MLGVLRNRKRVRESRCPAESGSNDYGLPRLLSELVFLTFHTYLNRKEG